MGVDNNSFQQTGRKSATHSTVVEAEKLVDYLLNPSHPVGGPKAKWFMSLGFSHDKPEFHRSPPTCLARLPKGHRRAGDVSPLIRWQRISWQRKELILSASLHVVLVRMAFRVVAPSRD
jgi:hypothetical protein